MYKDFIIIEKTLNKESIDLFDFIDKVKNETLELSLVECKKKIIIPGIDLHKYFSIENNKVRLIKYAGDNINFRLEKYIENYKEGRTTYEIIYNMKIKIL